jgi:hypothetical protein
MDGTVHVQLKARVLLCACRRLTYSHLFLSVCLSVCLLIGRGGGAPVLYLAGAAAHQCARDL